MGFNADIDIAGGGTGSSLSVNGGKTNLNADYQAVGVQSGIFTGDGGFDITAGGKTTLIGGAISEATEGSRTVGSDFPACTNCSGILPSSVNIPTGRVVNSDSLYRKE